MTTSDDTSAAQGPDSAAVADASEGVPLPPLSPFGQMLGERTVSATPDEVVLKLDIQPHLHQPYGLVHGGVWCSLVETAASVGAAVWLMSNGGGNVVGVSNHTDFLRAARDGEVTARATPIHRGRTQQLWLVEITDDSERLVARGQVRLQNLTSAEGLARA